MRHLTSPRMHVVRKEEKEARLTGFVTASLEGLAGAPESLRTIAVLARSYDSPVVRALAVHADTIARLGVHVRLLVVVGDAPLPEALGALVTGLACRSSRDPRLHDGHEQVVIGTHSVWIGDCMRRDPRKRDAYECYSEACLETAGFAMRSFERVWKLGRATRVTRHSTLHPDPRAIEVIEVALAALADPEGATVVSTRH